MQQKTLQQFIDRVTYEAGIDGQVTTTGRHSFANLTLLFNEIWDSLLALAAENGQIEALEETTAAALAAPVAGEDYISVAWPATAIEVYGVDVFDSCEGWIDLDPIRWAGRRTWKRNPDKIGWWAVKKLPKESGASITAGELAVFPPVLSGKLHKVYYREAWLPIAAANTTFTILGYPDWFQWGINSMVQIVTKRDTNKKDTFASASLLKGEAEARIRQISKKRQAVGRVVPRRRDGMDL